MLFYIHTYNSRHVFSFADSNLEVIGIYLKVIGNSVSNPI
jgi:hypothetical protein